MDHSQLEKKNCTRVLDTNQIMTKIILVLTTIKGSDKTLKSSSSVLSIYLTKTEYFLKIKQNLI